MEMLRRFWRQPDRKYRNFQLVYGFLTVNFLVPAATYYLDRDGTAERARKMGERFGHPELPGREDGYIWWILGAGNVATLGAMCLMLQLNLRRFRPVLPALLVLKSLSSIGFLFVWRRTKHPFFAAVSAYDGLTVGAMAYFAESAYRSLPVGDDGLLPRPVDVGV